MSEEPAPKFRALLLHDPEGKYLSVRINLRAPDGTLGLIYERITPGGSFAGYSFEELFAKGQGLVELDVREEQEFDEGPFPWQQGGQAAKPATDRESLG